MLHGLGIETGIDLPSLVESGVWICKKLGRPPASKAALALSALWASNRSAKAPCDGMPMRDIAIGSATLAKL